ncbi:hypothetical protein F2P81_007392 [Scophthalmus maximus]|uniref:FAM192A/Fyv6 N-terminal domain-containing protein n=1 Tax=Scophthalmus maximus TaxID=52904 RepID=A0A6A4TE60_SCOMX|nr:hypothetical protein F2P81_007392 [Scophthalmus maximus]
MEGGGATGVDLSRKFVSETELDEKRKKRQEEWEKVRKPDDPEEAPEEAYDSRSLFERLQEQKDKKQEEFEEQLKFNRQVSDTDSSSQSSDSSKKQKVEITTAATGNGDRHTEQEAGAGGGGAGGAGDRHAVPDLKEKVPSAPPGSGQGVLHLPSAAVCVGVLPGLWVYSGSSDSESSSDSEGPRFQRFLPTELATVCKILPKNALAAYSLRD